MNILSLFDGMSCGQIALERSDIKVDNYYASEVDSAAIEVTKYNYPNTIHIGDVTKVRYKEGVLYTEDNEYNVGKIDLVMGGSPCQGFSLSGTQQGFDDPRSVLFLEFVRILKEVNPKYFLLENVRMKKEFLDIITDQLNVEPIMINSSIVSAQNRVRYYWTNIEGLMTPENRNIYLKDIVDIETSKPLKNSIVMEKVIEKVKVRKYEVDVDYLQKLLKDNRIKTMKVISTELDVKKTTVEHWFRRDGSFSIPSADIWDDLKECLEIDDDVLDDSIKEFEIKDSVYDMSNRAYHLAGKSPTLTASNKNIKCVDDNGEIFYLTSNHFEKLQTVPDHYTDCVAENQAKKMLGNGWTVDVITHILKNIK